MGAMRYKPSDKVRIKSIDWYNENKDEYGYIDFGKHMFYPLMSKYCGDVFTIDYVYSDFYTMNNNDFEWTDEMIEGLVEEETKPNIIEEAKTYWDSIKDAWICPEGYIFKDENGNVINATKIVLEKKKKEYPKTYEECVEILCRNADVTYGYKKYVLHTLQMLLVCRDAYWKIAGEEMGLGKPWEPNWKNSEMKYTISFEEDEYTPYRTFSVNCPFAFPTEEMRDAFKENFDPDIEICKEFL